MIQEIIIRQNHAGRPRVSQPHGARRHFACTCAQLLIRRRLDAVARALRLGDDTVTAIALHHGFNNQSDFHRRFRQRFGTSPARYRKQAHQGH
ncbi:MAG: helix-turn-helix transcriptional regulator [Planctomycetota bacterium]|nr:helix-turn-helix transcriptional regulator [Planctomycetota bacterium]